MLPLACGLAGLAFLWLLPRGEPRYQGKSLSDWIEAMHQGKRPEREKARAVVHSLGTQSIPVLLRWLQRPDQLPLQTRFAQARMRAVSWLERRKLLTPGPRLLAMAWKESYPFLAVEAFAELGPDGQAAIPDLIRLLGTRGSITNEAVDAADFAYLVLRQMAPTSIPALTEALSSPDNQTWMLAAEALADIGPDAKAAIPSLRKRLADRDPDIQLEAAEALGKLGDSPAEFIPVVVGALRVPEWDNLEEKLAVLLQYKDQAHSAVPVLRELLGRIPASSNPAEVNARSLLTNALAQLSPQPLSVGTPGD